MGVVVLMMAALALINSSVDAQPLFFDLFSPTGFGNAGSTVGGAAGGLYGQYNQFTPFDGQFGAPTSEQIGTTLGSNFGQQVGTNIGNSLGGLFNFRKRQGIQAPRKRVIDHVVDFI